MTLLDGLNKEQYQAVISESSRILCLAGAGTGKTRVLTHRIAHLNDEHRVGTSNMLALTFTRLAGKEMKERVMDLVGEAEGQKLFCNTFHAFCVKVLKEYGHRIGLESNFMIYDQGDRDSIIRRIISEFHYDTSVNKVLQELQLPSDEKTEEAKVARELAYRLKQNNAIDLDGLLSSTQYLLNEHQDVRESYRQQFKYVFVDEFQDTSDVQMKIIRLLEPENLFVVGDDFQAIYGWRGADVTNILEFTKIYPECEVIQLSRNYRSTEPIVSASNRLIKHNENQTDKQLITDVSGVEVEFWVSGSETEEIERIIERLNQYNGSLSDVAILARTNKQLDFASNLLKENDISNVVLSNRNDPLKDSAVQSVIGFLELVVNSKESWKIKNLINFPEPRLRPMQLEEVELSAIEEDVTFLEALEANKGKFPSVAPFFSIVDRLKKEAVYDMDAATAFRAVVHVMGLITFYKDKGLDNRIERLAMARDKIERWVKVQQRLGESDRPEAFLRWLVTKDIQEKLMDEFEGVRLMTVHGAKGLEYDNVFVIGLNEGTFPSLRGDIEEERRLMYVAATRAKRKLFISRASSVRSFSGEAEYREPSRFIAEMGMFAHDEQCSRAKDFTPS